MSTFEEDLRRLLNIHSQENESGTPDFILATYMLSSLQAYNTAVVSRATWRGESVELHPLDDAPIDSQNLQAL